MNDELNKVTVIVDVERAQQEALILPEPAPVENTTSTTLVSG